ncbi:MAG: hypothetical protein CME88_07510 [Hirschia sp.]|nr:hypothetical protein [Hirschia sp.]MBF18208.1 hypothetical protein [Hirschia sp.]
MKKNWLTDFKLEGNGSVLIKKTGHRLQLDLHLAHDIFTWFCFYFFAQAWRLGRRLSGHKRPSIAFAPDKPRPWYLIWPVMHVAGARLVDDPAKADIVMQFDDSTASSNILPNVPDTARTVNFRCTDISKSRVSEAFETVAGYSLKVDPETYDGPMVDKSEINAAHDGRVIAGPIPREEGRAYQRLIDNTVAGGLVEDLRTCTVNGEPVLTFIKRRPIARRFLNENCEVFLVSPQDVFTADELDVIRAFTKEIHLDWGGVDVLRDASDGRIYIVDANKTDMGPPVALPLGQKLRATRQLARAFAGQFAS